MKRKRLIDENATADRQLSDTIADYWVNFAATGDPNGPGLPVWPKYNSNLDMVQILDTPVKTSVHPRKLELDRMERIYMDGR